MITKTEIERLAMRFRSTYNHPDLSDVDVWNTFEEIGGLPAILYGMFRVTPERSRWKRQDLAYSIATALDARAGKGAAK